MENTETVTTVGLFNVHVPHTQLCYVGVTIRVKTQGLVTVINS